MNDADVIVIGAGAAGLAAARELHRAGAKTIILEAQNRIGGRILTHHDDTHAFAAELGAEFIHGRPSAIFDLIEAAGLPALEVSGGRLLSVGGALRRSEDFWEIIDQINDQIDPSAEISYEQFLRSVKAPAFHKRLAKAYVEGLHAAHADLISAASILVAERAAEKVDGEKQFRLPLGYDGLIRELARGLPEGCLRLEHAVRQVRWTRRKVAVRCLCGETEIGLSAASLIATLPLSILRLRPDEPGCLNFEPPLTEKADALRHIEMGQVLKVVMRFRERFWEDPHIVGMGAPLAFVICPDAIFPAFWTTQPLLEDILVAWASGPSAEKLLGRSFEEIRRAAIQSLAIAFRMPPKHIASQLISLRFHDWSIDPFSRGAYSYPGIGGLAAAQRLAEPLEETLFFAGEATNFQGANGTVHAAIESGYRAAREWLTQR